MCSGGPAKVAEGELACASLEEVRLLRGGPDRVRGAAQAPTEEIGADLWAEDPTELCQVMVDFPTHRAEAQQRTVGRAKRPVRRAA